jgi:hypothetical protein
MPKCETCKTETPNLILCDYQKQCKALQCCHCIYGHYHNHKTMEKYCVKIKKRK